MCVKMQSVLSSQSIFLNKKGCPCSVLIVNAPISQPPLNYPVCVCTTFISPKPRCCNTDAVIEKWKKLYPFLFYISLSCAESWGPEFIPACIVGEAEYTPDRVPVHDRNDMYRLSDADRQPYILTFIPEFHQTVEKTQYHFRQSLHNACTTHAEHMQTQTQRGHRWVMDLNPKPDCCEVTLLL